MIAVIDILNRAGELWWRYVPQIAWQASLLAVVVLIVARLGRRWPSPLRYWLLVIVLVKFAVPPLLSLPIGVFSRIGPQVAPIESQAPMATSLTPADMTSPDEYSGTEMASETVPEIDPGIAAAEFHDEAVDPFPDTPDRVATTETTTADERKDSAVDVAAVGPTTPAVTSVEATPQPASSRAPLQWKAWLLLAHALGCLGVALWIVGQLVALQRAVRRAGEAADGALYRRFVGLWRSMSQRRPPRLLVSSEPIAPMALGLIRPAVVLPASAAETLPGKQLDTMLAHELAHVRRRDTWVNWFQLVLTAVWWFNPVLWLLNRAVRKVREECCDDLVLAGASSSNDAYCESLLHAASRLAACRPVGARLGFADRLHPLGARLKRIMDRTLHRAPALTVSGIVLVAFLAVVLLPGLGCRRTEDEPADQTDAADAEQWQALVDEQQKIIDEYRAELERLQQDTGTAKVFAEQVAHWERKLADEEAKLLAMLSEFGDAHPQVKRQRQAVELYKAKLDEAKLAAEAARAASDTQPEPTTSIAAVLAGQVAHWERKLADEEAKLLAMPAEFGDAHPQVKRQRQAVELYKAKLDEARTRAASAYAEPSLGPVEPGSRPELNQTLLDAAKEGNLAGVKSLLRRGAYINTRNDKGSTPLLLASERDHEPIAVFLIENGADIHAHDDGRNTPLHWAAWYGQKEIVQRLLEQGADIEAQEAYGQTPLDGALRTGHVDVAKLLIDHGAKLDVQGTRLRSLASGAAYGGHVDTMRFLMEHGFDPSSVDSVALLVSAAGRGHVDMLRLLIEHGASLSAADPQAAAMPLLTALRNGRLAAAAFLLDNGADPNARDAGGQCPLLAVFSYGPPSGHPPAMVIPEPPPGLPADQFIKDAVKLLIDHKADVNAKDSGGRTALWLAAQRGMSDVLSMLIAAGADVEAGRYSSTTTLHAAIQSGNLASVRALLEAGADVDADYPLFAAVQNRDKDMVQLLLDHNADVNHRMSYGSTVLHAAARMGDVEVLEALLKAGAVVNARNTSAEAPIHAAAHRGHRDAVEALIDAGADPDTKDSAGRTPLAVAVNEDHIHVVRLLISKGADPDAADAQRRTPLISAVSKGSVEVMKALLAAGANPDAKDQSYSTPLSMAAGGGRKDLVDLLLASGADPNASCSGGTPLLKAVGGSTQPDIAAALIAAGADVNAIDSRGSTPLQHAVQRRDEALAKLLLDAKARVDERDRYGLTPLHHAASGRDEIIAKLLLDKGADANARDKKQERTPLHTAASVGADEVVKLLIERGADVNARNESEQTPLDVAKQANTTGCIKLLEAAQGSGTDSTTRPDDAETPGTDDSTTLEPPPEHRARKRNWGPEQATGEPDTKSAGDMRTAWASKTRDGQDEWIELGYAEAVTPTTVKVYETYNPGALHKVSVFDAEGKEHIVWEGDDPTPSTTNMGVSEIKFTSDVKTKLIKLYLKSKEVNGWNEIDAVGLVDDRGTTQWAVSATASSTYASSTFEARGNEATTAAIPAADVSYEDDLAAFIKEMDERYPFFELKGIGEDWAEAKKELVEEAKGCTSDSEFLGLVVKAIRRLRSGQMYVYKAQADVPTPPARYYSGVSFLAATDKRVVVLHAPEQYTDALTPGTVVTTIDGQDARDVLEQRAAQSWKDGGHFSSPQRARLYEFRIPLRGEQGETHTITALVEGEEKDVVLNADVEAYGWPHVYNLPEGLTQPSASSAYTQLESGAGYIYLRRVDTTTAGAIADALKKHPETKGWIIDLRGNGGGGYTADLIEQLKAIPKPVAVLIDAGTLGAGETLARDIAAVTEARIFGSKSGGSSTAKRVWPFPSGKASVVMPVRSRWRSDRQPIEFNGIDPDVEVEAIPEELQQGQNSAICRAEEFLTAEADEAAASVVDNAE